MNKRILGAGSGLVTRPILMLVLLVLGGCMSVQKIDLPPEGLQDGIRNGGVVRPGDRIAVVSENQGEQVFVVTAVDQNVIRGESVEVPIEDVVTLEKRSVAPVRTGLAVYGGAFLVGIAAFGLLFLGSALGL